MQSPLLCSGEGWRKSELWLSWYKAYLRTHGKGLSEFHHQSGLRWLAIFAVSSNKKLCFTDLNHSYWLAFIMCSIKWHLRDGGNSCNYNRKRVSPLCPLIFQSRVKRMRMNWIKYSVVWSKAPVKPVIKIRRSGCVFLSINQFSIVAILSQFLAAIK